MADTRAPSMGRQAIVTWAEEDAYTCWRKFYLLPAASGRGESHQAIHPPQGPPGSKGGDPPGSRMITGQIGLRRHGTTLITKGIEWATDSRTHHVVLAISEDEAFSPEPGGAKIWPIDHWEPLVWSRFELTAKQRADLIAAAYARVGAPYNYAIYPPLLWQKLSGHRVHGLIAEWLSRRPHINCSQGVDDCYTDAGFHLFPDTSAIVTPGDLERKFYALGYL